MTKPSLLKQEILPETVGNNTYLQFSGYTVFKSVFIFWNYIFLYIYISEWHIKFRRLEESFPSLDFLGFIFF